MIRNRKEIKELEEELSKITGFIADYGIDGEVNDKDVSYLGDITDALQWILRKILTGQERIRIEEEIRDIMGRDIDKMGGDEFKDYKEFMGGEFRRDYKDRDPYAIGNVTDAFSWALGEISTEYFRSNAYLNTDNLKRIVEKIEKRTGKKLENYE